MNICYNKSIYKGNERGKHLEAQQLNNLLLSFTYLLQVLWKLVKEYWVLFAFAAFMIFLKRRK